MNNEKIDFEKTKQQILPYFVKIYGEEYRDLIVEKMNQIEPIFYDTIDCKTKMMNIALSNKRIELTIKFLKSNNIHLDESTLFEIIKNGSTYALRKIPEAYNLLSACFETDGYRKIENVGIKSIVRTPTDEAYKINRSVDTLAKLGIIVNPDNYNNWLYTEEARQAFIRIDSLRDDIDTLDNEFSEFEKKFENVKLIIEKSLELKRSIQQKYMIEFVKSLEKYTTVDDKKIIDEYLSSDKKDWYSFIRKLSIFQIIGNSFLENGLINDFSSDADEKLYNPNTSEYTKKTIIENRIKYYELIGIYKGQSNPEEFLMSAETKNYAPNKAFIDEAISKKKHYANIAEDEFLEITSSYKQDLEKINNLKLATNPEYDIEAIKNGLICISPNVKEVNNKYVSIALLLFSKEKCLPEYIDTMFIHEINHAIELNLLEYQNEKAKYRCGFETLTNEENEIRNYECISEIINQIIAMEVTEAMHNDNVYLFNNSKTAKTRGGTSYEQQKLFVDEFWKTFGKDIMKARISGNMSSLFNLIGEENFNELNTIISEYKKLPYYQMMNDVVNKKDTELTRKRIELYNNSHSVIEKMKEYAKQSINYESDAKAVK